LEEVAAGRARDLPAVRYRSRWGAAICALLRHNARDLTAHEISFELRKDQEFAYKLSRNPYQIYQTLRALVTAGKVNKHGKAYRLADS
jgi:Fe2+ or Zn2+ uptake regulation protein